VPVFISQECKPQFLAAYNSTHKNQFPILKLAAHPDTVRVNTYPLTLHKKWLPNRREVDPLAEGLLTP
jgi:hypothetical protein